MSELARLQEQFQHYILTGELDIVHSILSTKKVSAVKRLSIYQDAYSFRLIECLATSFPALLSYLGTEEFHSLCRSFIVANPSHYRSIRWYGDVLADFIKNYYTTHYAFLTELADFEWKMTLAFDAEDTPVVNIADMAAVPPDIWAELCFSVHPSVQRINYLWNAIPLWQALTADKEMPRLNEEIAAKPWVLWRNQEYIIQFYSLSQEEAWLLDGLMQGLSFGNLCEGLCEWIEVEQVAISAASYLKNWIQKGMLSQLHV